MGFLAQAHHCLDVKNTFFSILKCENSPQLKIIINLLFPPVCLDADGPEEFLSGELQTVTDEVRD